MRRVKAKKLRAKARDLATVAPRWDPRRPYAYHAPGTIRRIYHDLKS